MFKMIWVVALTAGCSAYEYEIDDTAAEALWSNGIDDPLPPPAASGLVVIPSANGAGLIATVVGAAPTSKVFVVSGLAGKGPCPPAISACLDVLNPVVEGSAMTDLTGTAIIPILVAGPGESVQAFTRSGASTVVSASAPIL